MLERRPEYELSISNKENVGHVPLLSTILEIFHSKTDELDGEEFDNSLQDSDDIQNREKIEKVLAALESSKVTDYMLHAYGYESLGEIFKPQNKLSILKGMVVMMNDFYESSPKQTSKGLFGVTFSKPKLFLNFLLALCSELDPSLVRRGDFSGKESGPILTDLAIKEGTFAYNTKLLREIFKAPSTSEPAILWTKEEGDELQNVYFTASRIGNDILANRAAIALAFGVAGVENVEAFANSRGIIFTNKYQDKGELYDSVVNGFRFPSMQVEGEMIRLANEGNDWAKKLIRVAKGEAVDAVNDDVYFDRRLGKFLVRIFQKFGSIAIARHNLVEILEDLKREVLVKDQSCVKASGRLRAFKLGRTEEELQENEKVGIDTVWKYRLFQRGIKNTLTGWFIPARSVGEFRGSLVGKSQKAKEKIHDLVPKELHARLSRFFELTASEQAPVQADTGWVSQYILRMEHYLHTGEFWNEREAISSQTEIRKKFRDSPELDKYLKRLRTRSLAVTALLNNDSIPAIAKMAKGPYGPINWLMDYMEHGFEGFDNGFMKDFDKNF